MAEAALPHDLDLERAVISDVLNRPAMLPEVRARLRAEHFYSAKYAEMYRAIEALADDGKPLDLVMLVAELRHRGKFEEMGAGKVLDEICEGLSVSLLAVEHAKGIVETFRARTLLLGASRLVEEARAGSRSEDIQLGLEAVQRAAAVTVDVDRGTLEVLREVMATDRETFEGAPEEMASRRPVLTGFDAIDQESGGLRRGSVSVLAARPGAGKTTLVLDVAAYVAGMGGPVLVVSQETGASTLLSRLAAARAGVSSHRLMTGGANTYERERWAEGLEAMQDWPIRWMDSGRATTAAIEAAAMRLRSAHHGIDLVVVDYLQLLVPTERRDNREAEVAAISRDLKRLAMSLDVPVLAAAQLSRSVEQRPNAMPRLSDLRESGAIEQDADLVLFLHRPDLYREKGAPPDGTAQLVAAKHRHGPTWMASLEFDWHVPRFKNAEQQATLLVGEHT